MAILNYYVNGQTIHKGKQPLVVADSIGYIDAEVVFIDEDSWTGLKRKICFKLDADHVYEVSLTESATGKWITAKELNLTAGTYEISVVGYDAATDTAVRIPTNTERLKVGKSGCINGAPLPSVTPTMAEKLDSSKVGYAEYSKDNYLTLYNDSDKGTLIAKLLISPGITESEVKTLIERYGYVTEETLVVNFYTKAEVVELFNQEANSRATADTALNEAIVREASLDDSKVLHFKNADGAEAFNADLSSLGGSVSVSDDGEGHLTITGVSVSDNGEGSLTIG